MKCMMDLLIYSQTLTIPPLEFGNGKIISPHTLLNICLLIYAGIKVKPTTLVKELKLTGNLSGLPLFQIIMEL